MRVPTRDVTVKRSEDVPSEVRDFATSLNDLLRIVTRAININEGSAIVVEGTGVSSLPAAEASLRGKLALVALSGASPDEFYLCHWNGTVFEWVAVGGGGGGGDVATDLIWDVKGDLAVGTGSNTADNLAVGADGEVLTADSSTATGLKWAAGGGGGITHPQVMARASWGF